MNGSQEPNLFAALYQFRPGEGPTPRENFLTEALVYLLRTHEAARVAWLRLVLGRNERVRAFDIQTRQSARHVESESSVYPDVTTSGVLAGRRFQALIEHKWNSPCNLKQLTNYAGRFDRQSDAHLVFVCQTWKQKRAAGAFPDAKFSRVRFRRFLWEEVYECLEAVRDKSSTQRQFLTFMKQQGLSPAEPISEAVMRAHLRAAGFIDQLTSLANRLLYNYDWKVIPQRYRTDPYPIVADQYGRVAIVFAAKDWFPAITVGFLYDTTDHMVEFTDEARGIDLFLRIETSPESRANTPAMKILRSRRRLVKARTHLRGEPGNGNSNTLFIAQKSLAAIIAGKRAARDQLDTIYRELQAWCRALFSDGRLERVLNTIRG